MYFFPFSVVLAADVGRTAARISLKIAYGYEGVTEDAELLRKAVEAMEVFCATARPGIWLVDSIPFRPYLSPIADQSSDARLSSEAHPRLVSGRDLQETRHPVAQDGSVRNRPPVH